MTHAEQERAALEHYGIVLSNRVIENLTENRKHAVCAGCRQSIGEQVQRKVRGIEIFHPSCAQRHDRERTPRGASNQIIGLLHGTAVPCNVWGPIQDRDGLNLMERIAPYAFHHSIVRGGQELRIGHGGPALDGRLVLAEHLDRLDFYLRLKDTRLNRDTLRRVLAGDFIGCSIQFANWTRSENPALLAHGALNQTIESGDLEHIALIARGCGEPAWYGTSVQATAWTH